MKRADAGDAIVVVPSRPGPLRRLPGARTPDEVDELLDEIFGPSDEGGPGVGDAVLATGGGATLVVGLLVSSTGLIGMGIGAVALGSVLPARAAWRQVRQRRLAAQRAELLDDGVALRASPGPVADLVAAHDALFAVVATRPDAVGAEERAAAHAAVADVAIVLGGGVPETDDEVAFVTERAVALAALVDGIAEAGTSRPRTPEDPEARRARLAARHEVDRIEGRSSADRLRDLAAGHDAGPADG